MAGLTDVKVRSAKSPERITKLSDGGGLQLWVTPAGGKHWKLAYRFDGKQKKLPIGPYPQIGLADARDRREVAKRLLARGVDPLAHEKATKDAEEKAAAVTFRLVAGELVERKEREERAASTLVKTRWLLDFAYPDIGDRPITEIKPAEVLAVLRKVEARGRLESARRLRSVIGEVFRYAIATARAEHDPTGPLKGALLTPKPKHRAALIDRKALGAMLRAIDGYDGQPATRHALTLLALLFPRPGELRLANWVEFDRQAAIWTIPAARTKMRRPHKVPLSRQALEVLRDLHKITGYGKLVFPGVGRGSRAGLPVEPRPISENTLNGALRRLGYGSDEATAHGFRASASTLLNESGLWNPDAIERALAHVEDDDVRRAYARGEHWDERVRMAQWWADELDEMRSRGSVAKLGAS